MEKVRTLTCIKLSICAHLQGISTICGYQYMNLLFSYRKRWAQQVFQIMTYSGRKDCLFRGTLHRRGLTTMRGRSLRVPRAKTTLNRFPTNILSAPVERIPLHSIPSVHHPWDKNFDVLLVSFFSTFMANIIADSTSLARLPKALLGFRF